MVSFLLFLIFLQFVKSQVEKRRRERMNRSLERLRTMLLQESQQLVKYNNEDFDF